MLARIRRSIKDKDAGFTLIELLVVMIIVGILAAIAIPVFLNQRKKAVDTAVKSDMRNVAQTLETTFVDSGTYIDNDNWPAVGTAQGVATENKLVGSARLSAGTVVQYKAISTGTPAAVTGFCLRGQSPKSNATGANYYWWVSTTGGAVPGDPTATIPKACA